MRQMKKEHNAGEFLNNTQNLKRQFTQQHVFRISVQLTFIEGG